MLFFYSIRLACRQWTPRVPDQTFSLRSEAREGGRPVVIRECDYGVVGCRSIQFNLVSRCIGETVLALLDAHFDVGTATFPLDLVVPRLESGSVDMPELQTDLRGRRYA
jgi:hypothetical protein